MGKISVNYILDYGLMSRKYIRNSTIKRQRWAKDSKKYSSKEERQTIIHISVVTHQGAANQIKPNEMPLHTHKNGSDQKSR